MKKIFYLFAITFCVVLSNQVFSQCDNEELLDVCYPKIGDYKYVKNYPIQLKKTRKGEPPVVIKRAVVLNGGVKYKIVACNNNEYDGKVVISLYSGDALIGTTYDYNKNKEYSFIEYDCKKSGVYYLSFYFREGREGCALCILAQK